MFRRCMWPRGDRPNASVFARSVPLTALVTSATLSFICSEIGGTRLQSPLHSREHMRLILAFGIAQQ